MTEEFQPDWDYQNHEQAAKDLAGAAVKATAAQNELEAKNPLFKRVGYEKRRAEYRQENLANKKEAYDNQILEAKSYQDFAHEQALDFTAIAERYKVTSQKLKEEF